MAASVAGRRGGIGRLLAVALIVALAARADAADRLLWSAPAEGLPSSATPWLVAPAAAEAPSPLAGDYIDLDERLAREPSLLAVSGRLATQPPGFATQPPVWDDALSPAGSAVYIGPNEYVWQLLPDGLIYKSYLAGVKESRISAHLIHREGDGFLWDATLGGRVGILRHGTVDVVRPQGFQLDVEGSAQVRLDPPEEVDVRSVDFRAGLPLTFGWGRHQTKLAYYHLSSHLGDEFLLKNPTFQRLNYSVDALVLGHAVFLTDELRLYGELAWSFHDTVARAWEMQFGLDFAPAHATGLWGAPFFALNGHLRQEVSWGGHFVVQVGWAWRGDVTGKLLRAGFHYHNGMSSQWSFYDTFEQQYGFGLWYDF